MMTSNLSNDKHYQQSPKCFLETGSVADLTLFKLDELSIELPTTEKDEHLSNDTTSNESKRHNVKVKKPNWKKPKGMPKRPMSAYNLYFQLQRERIIQDQDDKKFTVEDIDRIVRERKILDTKPKPKRKHRKTHGKISFGDMARSIALKWKNLDQSEKRLFCERAVIEKNLYDKAVKEWTCRVGKEKDRKITNSSKIPHAIEIKIKDRVEVTVQNKLSKLYIKDQHKHNERQKAKVGGNFENKNHYQDPHPPRVSQDLKKGTSFETNVRMSHHDMRSFEHQDTLYDMAVPIVKSSIRQHKTHNYYDHDSSSNMFHQNANSNYNCQQHFDGVDGRYSCQDNQFGMNNSYSCNYIHPIDHSNRGCYHPMIHPTYYQRHTSHRSQYTMPSTYCNNHSVEYMSMHGEANPIHPGDGCTTTLSSKGMEYAHFHSMLPHVYCEGHGQPHMGMAMHAGNKNDFVPPYSHDTETSCAFPTKGSYCDVAENSFCGGSHELEPDLEIWEGAL